MNKSKIRNFTVNISVFKNQVSYRNLLIFILCASIFPFNFFEKPGGGIDPSWAISINLSEKAGLVWGKDYMFSYGPLGYLATRYKDYVPWYNIVIFHVLIWANFCYIIYILIGSIKVINTKIFILVLLFWACTYHYLFPEISSFLLLCFLFWIIHALIFDKFSSAIIAVCISIIMFFVKLDTGLVINIFLLFFYIHQIVYNANRYRYLSLFFANCFGVFIFSRLLNVDMTGYLESGFHIVSAYNDAMYIPNNFSTILIGTTALMLFIFIFIQNLKTIFSSSQNFLSFLFCSMVIFILFKHGFLRHQGYGFIYPPLSLIVGMYIVYFFRVKSMFPFKVLYSILVFASFITMTMHFVENIDMKTPKLFNSKIYILKLFSKNILHKNYIIPARKKNGIDSSNIPIILNARIINEIGVGSVDIVPHLVSTVHFNHLAYNPRPGIQTYANYDAYLDEKGFEKYSSSNKPSFIIYCGDNKNMDAAIDNRYPFFDEPRTKLAMLQNYSIVDTFSNQILFKRSYPQKELQIKKSGTFFSYLNSPISIPNSSGLVLMSIKVKYNIIGKIVRFFYQPPALNIRLKLENGKEYQFKAIKSLLGEGVITNKLILNNDDVKSLFVGELNRIPQIKTITVFGDDWGLSKEIELSTSEFFITQ